MQERREIARSCPTCGKPLVVRTNGATGGQFLGCAGFPRCRHTEEIPLYFQLMRAGAARLPGMEDMAL